MVTPKALDFTTSSLVVKNGFTMIELLVITTIITILTGIVLASFISYKIKSKDSAIKGNLSNALIGGSVYFDIHGNYANFCSTYFIEGKIFYDAIIKIGVTPICNTNNSNTAWCVCAPLIHDATKNFCVDSTGIKKIVSTGCNGECRSNGNSPGACK
ncbi:MAG: hypothetical protein A2908_01550 [Candidatus Staskawiczbacteria bacterium RIFCSPLOWO2_01_FULL_38_12b]|uniref:Type II secretion system protein GspG C-terminal domain-containing protein n=1 Tax=Candidatus Staskawiczbacteria bacterium RIFCSPLOWO2_01_FULL_38_12b TaxID=1802214 RepID=A0A1G2IEC5_9BACT|nr:MAG: hypothetical protein A2908_01550 [Candidatus Staskawiczbacteria bacterium RIFCSPLOWO2_01_FULL_38_12b]